MPIVRFLRVFLFLLICAPGLSASASASASAAAPLTVQVYLPENLDVNGQQIPNTPEITEIFSYFERNANLKLKVVTLPWKRAQIEVLRGNGIIYGFSKSAERLTQYRFSEPVITLQIWAISYGEENAHFSTLSDLKGKRVTGGLGMSHGEEYEKARDHIFTVQENFLPGRERFKNLMRKYSDLVLVPYRQQLSRKQVEEIINKEMVPAFNDPALNGRHFNVSLKPIFYDTIHFASAKGHFDEVINRINQTIQSGTKNGSLPKLLQKYQ